MASTRVPETSSANPSRGPMPEASLVEPRLADEGKVRKTRKRLNPASNPPAIWKATYGTNRSRLKAPASVLARVIAGLMWAPEWRPRTRIIEPTVQAKTTATKVSLRPWRGM